MRKHAITEVKISEEITRVAKCPFKSLKFKGSYLGLRYCFVSDVFFADHLVGSDHRKSDWKDLNGTYKVDHLAILGTSPPVSFEKSFRTCN